MEVDLQFTCLLHFSRYCNTGASSAVPCAFSSLGPADSVFALRTPFYRLNNSHFLGTFSLLAPLLRVLLSLSCSDATHVFETSLVCAPTSRSCFKFTHIPKTPPLVRSNPWTYGFFNLYSDYVLVSLAVPSYLAVQFYVLFTTKTSRFSPICNCFVT